MSAPQPSRFEMLQRRYQEAVPVSIPRPILLGLFTDTFQIEQLVEGSTEVAENRWASAWIYFRRLG